MLDRVPFVPVYEDETGCDPNLVYLEVLDLVERLHRLFLEVIKDELRRLDLGEITPARARLLFHIGHKQLTAGEVVNRGYSHGANVSYTLSKLVEGGFLRQDGHGADRRSVLIPLSGRGKEVRDIVAGLIERHCEELDAWGWTGDGRFDALCRSLGALERFWVEQRMLT